MKCLRLTHRAASAASPSRIPARDFVRANNPARFHNRCESAVGASWRRAIHGGIGLGRWRIKNRVAHVPQSIVQEMNQGMNERRLPFTGDNDALGAMLLKIANER